MKVILSIAMRLAIALLGATLAAQTPGAQLRWLPVTSSDLEVDGLPWFAQNKGELLRLPLSLERVVRPEVWNLAKSPSGGRIRFRTDSPTIAIRLEYPSAPNMANMHAFGQTGVDLYAGSIYISSAIADKDAAPGKTYEKVYFSKMPRIERDITIYLPLYKPVKVLGIGLEPDVRLSRARPFAYRIP